MVFKSTDKSSDNNNDGQLKKNLNVVNGVSIIVGIIVGSGIFVSPTGVLIQTGSVGGALLVWVTCGVICLAGALCLAELGILIPSSGGIYAYIQEVFGDCVAFVYLWTCVIIVFPAANAAIALVFANYILHPVFPCDPPDSALRLLAACALALLTYINYASVDMANQIQIIFTIIKCVALFIIMITGVVIIAQGKIENFEYLFEGTTKDPGKIALAFYSGMFSYSGWYTLNFLTEELKNPSKQLPMSIWISLPLVTFIYVTTNVAYFAVLTQDQIIKSNAVAVTLSDKLFGYMAWCMPIFVAFSCFGTLNGCILSVSRMFFVGAREGHAPGFMSLIGDKCSPAPAIIFEGVVSICLLVTNDIFFLINCVSFVEALSFLLFTIALIVLRFRWPDRPRPIKVPLIVPILFALVCAFLVIYPVFSTPMETTLGFGCVAICLVFYIICVKWEKKPKAYHKYMRKFTIMCQKLFNGLPEKKAQ